MPTSSERFTHTVSAYHQYRPTYPRKFITILENQCGLTNEITVADVGSGTGRLTKLLLEKAKHVYGVEPNKAMRQVAESEFSDCSNFQSIEGRAEATKLPNQSVELITAGTAFHWFDLGPTKKEFQRILKPDGWVVLVWNARDIRSFLMRDYEALLVQYAIDYVGSPAETFHNVDLSNFFESSVLEKTIRHVQIFDWTSFQGRLLSTSYCPPPTHPNYLPMMENLKLIFDQYQQNSKVKFSYLTKSYIGKLHQS